jgi:hypothetical protein
MHRMAASSVQIVKFTQKRTVIVRTSDASLSVVREMTGCHTRSPFWRAGTDHADMGSSDF